MINKAILFFFATLSCLTYAEEFLPTNIVKLDQKFSHHTIVVEKSTHSLFLFKNNEGTPTLIKKYQIATGKFAGNKSVEGDKKTPEGIYTFGSFLSDTKLNEMYGQEQGKIYGAGAFTTNYPNTIDRRKGKTGGGIWLHSTDDNSRIEKGLDSKGCVVVIDQDLKDISQFIDLDNTSMVIVENLTYLNSQSWKKVRDELVSVVETWQDAWSTKDFDRYITSYDPERFFDSSKGNYQSFKAYKKAVFSRQDNPLIKFTNVSILMHKDYAVVNMEQDYKSPVIDDLGKKTLYLQKNADYEWKIVSEQWEKLDKESRNIAFVPAMRFFKN